MAELSDAFKVRKPIIKRLHDRVGTLYGKHLRVTYPLYVDEPKQLYYTYTDTNRLIPLNMNENDNGKVIDLPLIGIKYLVQFDKNLMTQHTKCDFSHIPRRLPHYYRVNNCYV
jgi:hypothetical protein